ncbi:hypothetical protein KDL44_12300 [bacterium]|nr:hypothetical protein [bacterium]
MRDSGRYRPWIWRRMLLSALISSIVPVTVISILLFTLSDNGAVYTTDLSNQVRQELQDQFLLSTEAQSDQISQRLVKIGYNVELLRAYATDLLTSQEAYARDPWEDPEGAAVDGEGESADSGETEDPANSDPAKAVQYLENPIYYSQGDDGAIRKIIDDNGSVLFFRRPDTSRDFTRYERQKMQVTARLDSLLKGPTRYDQLVSHAYIVTSDSMLRAYPFIDVATWPADKDLTKPAMYAWSPEKANDRGLVWTSPYVSHLSGEWVVSCLGQVAIGTNQVAVVGCEVRVSRMMDELLSFSIGPGGISWLQRSDGTLLSAQTSAVDYLRVIPIGNAELPSDKHPEQTVREEANLEARGNDEIKRLLGTLDKSKSEGRVLEPATEGRYFVMSPVAGLDWLLAGTIQSRSIALTSRQKDEQLAIAQQKFLIAGVGLIVGLIIAFVMAGLEGRRILQPVQIMISKLREYTVGQGSPTLAIADEGEIGELANAVQDVVDKCSRGPESS